MELRAAHRAVEPKVGLAETPWCKHQGYVSLESSTLHFHDVSGALGTGTLALNGTIALAGLQPRKLELSLVAQKLSLEPQARFQLALNADTVLRWSRDAVAFALRAACAVA